ncbi:hypothetical protein HYV89_03635 [Candidatus Woesearchaeota archaeon]|nr:hypothetical protein [Candidatus Woesearchaeota archaeon]
MASIKLMQEAPISLSELKEKIHEVEARDNEISFRANKVKDYLNKIVKLDMKTASELKQKLLSLDIPRLKDRQIIKITDILPEDLEELRAIFMGEVTTITQENLEKIVEAVKPFTQKQKSKK